MSNTDNKGDAPGWPGIPARWTSSAKTGVGAARQRDSRVWFTISHGILNEVYYLRVDQACTRDLGLIVSDGSEFFSEEKRHTRSEVNYIEPGVAAYRLVNTCTQGRYRIEKEIIADPWRDAVLQRIRFVPLQGALSDYHLYALLAPHLGNFGMGNTAWTGDYKGTPVLMAERDGVALALACSDPWLKMSAGFVGFSDGWQDLANHRQLTWEYMRAENGNVALAGEVDLKSTGGEFVLALGFGRSATEAAQRALASMVNPFEAALEEYVRAWRAWQNQLLPLNTGRQRDSIYRVSASVLRTHESKAFPGGIIASLSIPWGFNKGDDDLGGYHLVWPRDLVEIAGGLLAAGAKEDAVRVLQYLQVTQEADGHWSQNMWLDGQPYWGGVQMDETAFPILLVDLLRREQALDEASLTRVWPMVRRAAAYLVGNGPVTQQDRWEEDPGYSPFTLAVEIAALLVAADLAEGQGRGDMAEYLRETADVWNESIERWTYVTGTDMAAEYGVEGYYVRIAPPQVADAASPSEGFVPIKNRPPGASEERAEHLVSPDFLALVRFGLRAPEDSRILNTLKIVDALLKVETPQGPLWRRYNGDGYGEHEDGSPFDGTGIGRAWPLLAGERAHYELAAGRREEAERLLRTLEDCANEGGLIPEQVWDAADIPEKELFFGRASGSAQPLVWAHAEHIKLRRSLREGRIFDQPPQPTARYRTPVTSLPYRVWRFNNKCRTLPRGRRLRIETLAPAMVHWSSDGWRTLNDTLTRDTGLGVHIADIASERLAGGAVIDFTLYWSEEERWEGQDYRISVE